MKPCCLFILLLVCLPVSAQDSLKRAALRYDPTLRSFVSAGVITALPLQQFREQPNFNTGIGLSLRAAYRIFKDKPLLFGLSADYLLCHKAQSNGILTYTNGTQDDIRTTVNNNIFSAHAFIHLEPRLGNARVFPFVEGLAGFRHFYTRATLVRRADSKQVDSYSLQKSFAFSCGGAVGLSLPFGKTELELRILYLTTPAVEYVLGKSVQVTAPYGVDYLENRSPTPTLFFQIGIQYSNL